MKINKTKFCIVISMLVTFAIEACSQSGSTALQTNDQFILKGDLSAVKEPVRQVRLTFKRNGISVVDSAKVINQKFEFKNSISEAVQAYIFLDPDTIAMAKIGVSRNARRYRFLSRIFLDKASIEIIYTDEPDIYKVKGSPAHADYEKIMKQTAPILEKYNVVSELLENKKLDNKLPKDSLLKLSLKMAVLNNETFDTHLDFSNKNPGSPIAVWALSMYLGRGELDTTKLLIAFSNLSAENKSSYSGLNLGEKLKNFTNNSVNKKAIAFSLPNSNGKLVSLSSFKGKYVLIDFWASWCVPCRAENPNLVEQYRKYNNKGFEIIGIGIEQTNAKTAWLKAIEIDKLTWTQLCDFKYWDSKILKEYSVFAIPHNVLVNPDGDIIAINLKGNDLTNKLKEIFK